MIFPKVQSNIQQFLPITFLGNDVKCVQIARWGTAWYSFAWPIGVHEGDCDDDDDDDDDGDDDGGGGGDDGGDVAHDDDDDCVKLK